MATSSSCMMTSLGRTAHRKWYRIADEHRRTCSRYDSKDDFGQETTFPIPMLKDVLSWSKQHGAYLMLDFKKGISYQKVAELVRAEQMEAQVVLISYNVEQAKALHKVAPEMLISVTVRNQAELDRILETGIPNENSLPSQEYT